LTTEPAPITQPWEIVRPSSMRTGSEAGNPS